MSNQALYLKWRPQAFDEVIGQEHIVTTLLNSLRQNRIRHAYLFSGPRGTGKTTTARLLAKAVNCTHPDVASRPCNDCDLCRSVQGGQLMDLIEIDAASHTSVDDVRDLRDKIAFAPSLGQYKVYIIDEVHRFSGAAFDALLKTLEEPPPHAIFVLATTEIDKVPATIKSRCLLFEFRRVSLREVMERLQMICDGDGISIEPAALELIARQGTGSVRDSISLLDQVLADPTQKITLELAQNMLGVIGSRAVQGLMEAFVQQDLGLALNRLNEAIDMGADPRQFGQQVVEHLRQLLLVKIGGMDIIDASDEMRALLAEQAEYYSRPLLVKAIRLFTEAVNDLRGGWQPQLPLELAIVETLAPDPIPRAAAVATPQQEAAKPAPPPAPVPTSPEATAEEANLQVILQRWGQVLNAPQIDAHIRGWWKHCRIIRLEGSNTLVVATTSVFVEKLKDAGPHLSAAIEHVFGVRLHIDAVVQDIRGKRIPTDELEALALSMGADISENTD